MRPPSHAAQSRDDEEQRSLVPAQAAGELTCFSCEKTARRRRQNRARREKRAWGSSGGKDVGGGRQEPGRGRDVRSVFVVDGKQRQPERAGQSPHARRSKIAHCTAQRNTSQHAVSVDLQLWRSHVLLKHHLLLLTCFSLTSSKDARKGTGSRSMNNIHSSRQGVREEGTACAHFLMAHTNKNNTSGRITPCAWKMTFLSSTCN